MEEVVELARLISRTYGDQSFKKTDLGRTLQTKWRTSSLCWFA